MNVQHSLLIILIFLSPHANSASEQLTTIGWIETVRILPEGFDLQAKIDTGADNSSVDIMDWKIIERDSKEWVRFKVRNNKNKTHIFERPLQRYAKIKRKQSEALKRPVVEMGICIGKDKMQVPVNLAKRENFEFRMLIGRSVLKGRFLVDSSTTHTKSPECG